MFGQRSVEFRHRTGAKTDERVEAAATAAGPATKAAGPATTSAPLLKGHHTLSRVGGKTAALEVPERSTQGPTQVLPRPAEVLPLRVEHCACPKIGGDAGVAWGWGIIEKKTNLSQCHYII